MAQKKQTKKIQKKKKKWCTVAGPKIFRNMALGETPVFEEEDAIGRKLKINLMTLIRDPKKQNINITFKITEVKNYSASTEAVGYEIFPSTIKRLVKRKKEKIEDSFVCETKDGVKVRIKPLVIANNKGSNALVTSIRKKIRNFLGKTLLNMTYESYFSELITGKMQSKIRSELKKLYPCRAVEIRKSLVEIRDVKPINPDDYVVDLKKIEKKKPKNQEDETTEDEKDSEEKEDE